MTWKLYIVPAMDAEWDLWFPVEAARSLLAAQAGDDEVARDAALRNFDAVFDAAKTEARRLGWQGDLKVHPRVFWMPGEKRSIYGIAWQAEDDEVTYVASPVAMPHLDAQCIDAVDFHPFGDEPVYGDRFARRKSTLPEVGKSPSVQTISSDRKALAREERERVAAIQALSPFERLYAGSIATSFASRRTLTSARGREDMALLGREFADLTTTDGRLIFILSLRLYVLVHGQLTEAQRECILPR